MTSSPIFPAHMKHMLTAIVLFSMSAFATAQTTPTTRDQSRPATQQPGTTQQTPQQGWQWFDDNTTRDLNINADRMNELREMDKRYRTEYDALGRTPWTHDNYQTLTDRRNADVQRLLTPEQYRKWSQSATKDATPLQTPGTPAPRR
jgi:hypothetical protein